MAAAARQRSMGAIEAWARGVRSAELSFKVKEEIDAQSDDAYRMTPIPRPPFRDDTDRDASLGAALVHVAHTVTGRWPSLAAVAEAVRLLVQDGVS